VDASLSTVSGQTIGTEPIRDRPAQDTPHAGQAPSAEMLLVTRARQGDAEAGHRFFREYYPGIYRYLLWLTERPETAEDLAQETFVRAWRHLDQFDDRGPLRAWLHRIAHREFLRSLRGQRTPASLADVAEASEPRAAELTEAVELRAVIRKLPVEEGEIVVLHYLQGYNCEEIARIVRAPATTVKYRLMVARSHLQRELGEGDMTYLNEAGASMRHWAWLPLDQMHALEARLARTGGRGEEAMGRRGEGKADLSAAASAPARERDRVDARLARKVTLAFKATALTDVCEHLRADTGIHLAAGSSVADEKVTLFCKSTPLREVMRQLSRPFGYSWLRSGAADQYRYELVQDLRSQLLEEELRNRDRHAALLALEREMEKFRPYLDLSPDEALAKARAAGPEEKKLLETLAGKGWAQIQMFFRISAQEMAALRSGQELRFSEGPKPGEQPLPPDVAHGVLQTLRDWRLAKRDGKFLPLEVEKDDPTGLPPSAVPEARAWMNLSLGQSELGQFTLRGTTGYYIPDVGGTLGRDAPYYAAGLDPSTLQPDNRRANARLSRDRSLQRRINLRPEPGRLRAGLPANGGSAEGAEHDAAKVTSADVLEALHQATGLPVIADYYTRLYPVAAVTLQDQPLFEILNHAADAMRLRWHEEDGWLQFRSASYYHDRLKEVPNRLLTRWAARRREQGALSLDDLIEIAQLPDEPLDGEEMGEGAKELFGLAEWDLPRSNLRSDLRYLAGFTPEQRREATSPAGLPFMRMPLAQQQGFLSRAVYWDLRSLEDLAEARLRVDYSQPGEFEWRVPGPYWLPWIVPLQFGREGKRGFVPTVRERTREAALQALRRVDPQIREAVLRTAARHDPRLATSPPSEAEQIAPTRLDLTLLYVQGFTNEHDLKYRSRNADFWAVTE
jgi:RNA polymerase sigma-70 factor, ECF subfamily